MRHPRLLFVLFAGCVLVVFAAMGWITLAVLRLDSAEAESRRRAQLEEHARLALWRMDSALAPLVAQEHARPAVDYLDPPAGRSQWVANAIVVGNSFTADNNAPPLPDSTPFVRLYFHLGPDGVLRAPNVAGNMKASTKQVAVEADRGLRQLQAIPLSDALAAGLPRRPARGAAGVEVAVEGGGDAYLEPFADELFGQQAGVPHEPDTFASGQQSARQEEESQAARNYNERRSRARNTAQQVQIQQALNASAPSTAEPGRVRQGAMRAVWAGGHLLLARRVIVDNTEHVQGCWVDWPAVRPALLGMIADLLPHADLVAVPAPAAEGDAHALATLPVRLVPGELADSAMAAGGASPLRWSLWIAWACTILAAAAVAMLLRGAVSLSERRGAFVSAVTHELRTPLTTLRLYTEMLADGMVGDGDQQKQYLQTLRSEADRLGHLVENVLAYSRLERNRSGFTLSPHRLGDLLDRTGPRLAERAKQAGMTLEVDQSPDAADASVRTNALALEQVLFNLVDNACKYAAGSGDRSIRLTAVRDGGHVVLRVQDRGPGIPRPSRGRLFRPFSKSVHEAAESAAPGLGLGLALSRRLARELGGDLRFEACDGGGACFAVLVAVA